MPKVLIVARTQMGHGHVCVGGYHTSGHRNVRLLDSRGANQPENCAYQVGELWQMSYAPRQQLVSPHTEDVLVSAATHVKALSQKQLGTYIREHCHVVAGPSVRLFSGCVQFPQSGAAYIGPEQVPDHSVCFWEIDHPLEYTNAFNKHRYRYYDGTRNTYLPYVGTGAQVDLLPAGSLVRVSLARWWAPPDQVDEHCYLQLSGWY